LVANWSRTLQLAETDSRLNPENAQSANVYGIEEDTRTVFSIAVASQYELFSISVKGTFRINVIIQINFEKTIFNNTNQIHNKRFYIFVLS